MQGNTLVQHKAERCAGPPRFIVPLTDSTTDFRRHTIDGYAVLDIVNRLVFSSACRVVLLDAEQSAGFPAFRSLWPMLFSWLVPAGTSNVPTRMGIPVRQTTRVELDSLFPKKSTKAGTYTVFRGCGSAKNSGAEPWLRREEFIVDVVGANELIFFEDHRGIFPR